MLTRWFRRWSQRRQDNAHRNAQRYLSSLTATWGLPRSAPIDPQPQPLTELRTLLQWTPQGGWKKKRARILIRSAYRSNWHNVVDFCMDVMKQTERPHQYTPDLLHALLITCFKMTTKQADHIVAWAKDNNYFQQMSK